MGARRGRKLALVVAVLTGVMLALSSCGSRPPKLIPRTVLFGNPEKIRARISPDGKRLAYVAPLDGVLNVYVKTIGEDNDRPVTADKNRGIYEYFWAYDNNHLMYLQDKDGDENWRLYAVDLSNETIRDLTPYENVQVRVMDVNKDFPNTVVLAMNLRDPSLHDVYRLDLPTGELTLVATNPGNVIGWVTDANLDVRAAMAVAPSGDYQLLARPATTAPWETILTWGPEDNMTSAPVAFTKDGGSLYLIDSSNVNAGRLVRLDLKTKDVEVLAEDPIYDVSDLMINPDTYKIEAVSFEKARKDWVPLDPEVAQDFTAIRSLDDGDFDVVSYDADYRTWLVAFVKDDGPIAYYIFDRDSETGEFLFDHRTDLKNYTLARMEPFSFNARDGLPINGYITFPPNAPRKNLPMVLVVHGGPWARDEWGYNPEVQWIANRGYICLQVNFRGSSGYGKEFLNAGDKEWGAKMQDDLTDGVNWAIDQGYADPKKIAIYGASYGGYAALAGAAFTPDLYCCAIPMMGPSNLITFINSVPPYWTTMLETMYKRIGNPQTEEEFLKSRSPLFSVGQIKIPMLVAQGANDVRVKQAESEQVVEAMQKNGVDVEYILFEDEGHGFAKPENRLKFFARAEQFLAKYLGGRYEPAPAES
jgi:dipeptidyl aminopeptidase/acylaminoacyl peptidase